MDDLTGRTLGRFHLVERLGEGGVGVVYRAEDLKIPGRVVALKFLKPLATSIAEHRDLLRAEISALSLGSIPMICLGTD